MENLNISTSTQFQSNTNYDFSQVDIAPIDVPEAEPAEKEKSDLYKCELCSSEYKKFGTLTNHKRIKHGIENQNIFTCTCGKTFDEVKKFNRHKKSKGVNCVL